MLAREDLDARPPLVPPGLFPSLRRCSLARMPSLRWPKTVVSLPADAMGSDLAYSDMSPTDKPLVWLAGEVRTPPFLPDARLEAGFLLRQLQQDESLSMPHSRQMTGVGRECHELRVVGKRRRNG